MTNTGQLLFWNAPWFPVVWVIGLLGFLACLWYVCRDVPAVRRLFLALWLPAALVASAVYKLEGHNQAVAETLRLIAGRDPATLRLLLQPPADGFAATYAMVVGGTVAALSTMALQLAGMVLGAIVNVSPAARRGGRGR